jgi:hypothetical protein
MKEDYLMSGHDIRGMARTHNAQKEYTSNWDGIDLSNTKYLLDKSIINPSKYNYKVMDWENYRHKLIYMIRNIHKVLKSQFLIVLAGEESYQYQIGKHVTKWDIKNFDEKMVKLVIDYNKQKYSHYQNIMALDKNVFDLNVNTYFCTFEDFKSRTSESFKDLGNFIGLDLNIDTLPRLNGTKEDWYEGKNKEYEFNKKLFDEYENLIYNYCIDYDEWYKLSEIADIDFLGMYGIKRYY